LDNSPKEEARKKKVDVYYIYLAATHTPQSSQGTNQAWHPRVDYELLL